MKVAIIQSNYIPWKGYFDQIGMVDLFVFHDDLQYTKQDWRNRNKIKTPRGTEWLTVPCGSSEDRLICEVELNDAKWQKKHWGIIQQNYAKTPGMPVYKDFLKEFYQEYRWTNLSDMNQWFIMTLCREFLGIDTDFIDSRELNLKSSKAQRVMDILKAVGATEYLSGPAAKDYLDPKTFEEAGIQLEWMDYSDYPEYRQKFPPFEHGVSIIDLLLNEGENATRFMKYPREERLSF